MPSTTLRDERRHGLEPFLHGIAERWRSWRERNRTLADLAACRDDEVARIAADVGISPGELRELATHNRHDADLLGERMQALRLDVEAVANEQPTVMRELQRLCTVCEQKGRCAHDLMRDPGDPSWKEYCPNAATLTELPARP